MTISRRTFVKLGLGGTAVLAMGGIGLTLGSTKMRKPRRALQALDERSFSILAAVANRLSPGGNGYPSAWTLEVPEKVDGLLSKVHPGDIQDISNGLMLIENGLAGLLFDGRWGNFTTSSRKIQDQTLEAFRTSSLQVRRSVFKALYSMCTAAYWSNPVLNQFMGYPGPPDYGNGHGQGPSRPQIGMAPSPTPEQEK